MENRETRREVLIGGQLSHYDFMSDYTLSKAKKYYKNFKYIGSSDILYINGVKQEWGKTCHFFSITEATKINPFDSVLLYWGVFFGVLISLLIVMLNN